VQTASLVPQDQSWTPAIYLALAREYRELNQFHNAIDAYDLFVRKWPVHRHGLGARFERAMCWETLAHADRNLQKKAASAFSEVLQQARPGGAWRDANASDPSATEEAGNTIPVAERHWKALP
jgi:hypothetical protein